MGNYKVESDFMHNGLRCVVVFTSMGHRCGYVGIDKEHPLFGKYYSSKCLKMADIEDQPIGKRGIIPIFCAGENESELVSPDLYFDVHGSITFSGGNPSDYPVKSALWWFGFDCAHAGDESDYKQAFDYGILSEDRLNALQSYRSCLGGVHRSKEYVESECKSLADQLKKLTEDDGQCSD